MLIKTNQKIKSCLGFSLIEIIFCIALASLLGSAGVLSIAKFYHMNLHKAELRNIIATLQKLQMAAQQKETKITVLKENASTMIFKQAQWQHKLKLKLWEIAEIHAAQNNKIIFHGSGITSPATIFLKSKIYNCGLSLGIYGHIKTTC